MFYGISLRQRILLTLLPLFLLLGVLGGTAMWLLHQLGGRIDTILRENYDSVVAMQNLKESLERIDSSFQFLLVARELKNETERQALETKARSAFTENWQHYQAAFAKEQANVTIHPGEDELVARLGTQADRYFQQGESFFDDGSPAEGRHDEYYGQNGLYNSFLETKQLADAILQLNQQAMKHASDEASRSAVSSLVWLSLGFASACCLAGLAGWQSIRMTLRPIRAVKEAALGITAGNLDQIVPVFSRDELGQLAEAFNVMARHLREYRQSQSAHLLRTQQTTQSAIDSFPDAILMIDADGRMEMANPAARRLFGIPPLAPGNPAVSVWQPPSALRQPLDEALLKQHNYLPDSFEHIVLLGETGLEHAYLPRILTIRDAHDRTLGAAVVLQDVTRLRLLDQMKSNLVATASHELKTPLTSLRLAVHLLLEETIGPLNPRQTELLLDARENSERLLAMINNLLDLARLEQSSRQLELEPASPGALLRDAADRVRARADDKNIELIIDVPPALPSVTVDIPRIGHALRNLLDNAVTYTDSGGTIRLAARAEGDNVILSVRDTGCGIPAESVPHVFEKFFRVPGQSRGGGTGLGLAIVQEIVSAHGGRVDCESQPDVGTTFRIRLPIAAADPTRSPVFSDAEAAITTVAGG